MKAFNNVFTEQKRESLIKAEEQRLTGIFENVGQTKEKALKDVIKSAAFYSVMLQELQIFILREGAYDSLILYNTILPTYSDIISNLVSMLPEEEQNDAAAKMEMLIRSIYEEE